MKVKDMDEDLDLVTDQYEIDQILEIIGEGELKGEYGALFVGQEDGDYTEIWGHEGNVPYMEDRVYPILREHYLGYRVELDEIGRDNPPLEHYTPSEIKEMKVYVEEWRQGFGVEKERLAHDIIDIGEFIDMYDTVDFYLTKKLFEEGFVSDSIGQNKRLMAWSLDEIIRVPENPIPDWERDIMLIKKHGELPL